MNLARKPVWFKFNVPASGSGELVYQVQDDCTLERLFARVWAGVEWSLKLTPVLRSPTGVVEYILETDDAGSGDRDISGDDDFFDIKLALPVPSGWSLVLQYQNTDAVNAHRFIVCFEVDYAGGLARTGVGLHG